MSDSGPTDPSDVQQQAISPDTRTSRAAIASLVLSLLGFCFSLFTSIPAVICGIFALVKIGASNGRLRGTGLAVAGIVISCVQLVLLLPIMVALLLPAIQIPREAARRTKSTNNVRQIGVGLVSFEAMGRFPPAGVNEQGEGPSLSWRVFILPSMEQVYLYERFERKEAWDSAHNRPLADPLPAIYKNPNGGLAPNKTNYLAVTGPDTVFPGGKVGLSRASIQDGLSRTAIVVEADADQAAVWTEPKDWEFDPNDPGAGLGSIAPVASSRCLPMAAGGLLLTTSIRRCSRPCLRGPVTKL